MLMMMQIELCGAEQRERKAEQKAKRDVFRVCKQLTSFEPHMLYSDYGEAHTSSAPTTSLLKGSTPPHLILLAHVLPLI